MSCSAVKRLDLLGYGDTWIHRRDSRAKLIAALVFLVCVASFPKYDVSALIPFFALLVVWGTLGEVPHKLVFKIMVVIAPCAVLLGAFNPFLDRQPAMMIGSVPVSGGVLSFFSILLRFVLSAGMALLLVGTTSMPRIFNALVLLRVPRTLVLHLDFLYRYLFALIDEGADLNNARNLRDPAHALPSVSTASKLLSVLLFRSMERARRVFLSMQARGFDGEVPTLHEEVFSKGDFAFLVLSSSFCLAARIFPLAMWAGIGVQGALGI